VTGAAGFVGLHLCRRLVKEGHGVIGVDFPDKHYEMKNFEFIGADLCDMNYAPLLKGVDVVYHLAAEASVRESWGEGFSRYLKNNIEATQKLLEVVKEVKIRKFIYASSFAVYDTCVKGAISETSPLLPYSPYGMTKLAAENLCFLYCKNYNVPVVSLRFFSIYGQRERHDTAFHRFMKAIAMGQPIQLYGDGKQTRDVTYIDDAIDAYLLATTRGKEGEAYNIGTGRETKLNDVLSLLKDICGQKVKIKRMPKQKGDVLNVVANIDKVREHLGFSPKTTLAEGLEKEWQWIKGFYGVKA
jgi:UDP-glucose 4-epimerase